MNINPKSGRVTLTVVDVEVIERAVRLAEIIQSYFEGDMRVTANKFELQGKALLSYMKESKAESKYAPGQRILPGMETEKEAK